MPIEKETFRSHLQINHNADDNVVFEVGGYVPAAVSECEKRGQVSLIRQSRKQYIGAEDYPVAKKSFALQFGPVLTVTAVRYLDSNDATQTYPAGSYSVRRDKVYFKANPPSLAEGPESIWIEYEAGYGNTPSDVPAEWQSIVMQLAYRRYELRGESPGPQADAWERMMDRQIVIAGGDRRGY